MRTEMQKMLAGKLYDPGAAEIQAELAANHAWLARTFGLRTGGTRKIAGSPRPMRSTTMRSGSLGLSWAPPPIPASPECLAEPFLC